MAYERISDIKTVGDGIDSFIENLSKTYDRQLSIRNAEDELRFNEAVLSDNLSLNEQLEYRKSQLKRSKSDPVERKRIRAEIAVLNDRIENKKFTDSYTDKLVDYQTGTSSIDSLISWLEDQSVSSTDENIKQTIKSRLSEAKSEKFELTKQLIQNQTQYAINDKSETTLNNQIKNVEKYRKDALLSGNDTLVSVYDLNLQSLNKSLREVGIEKSMLNFAANTMSGFSKSVDLLNSYNNKIQSSSTDGPITIGGTTYTSERDFWNYKRDEYLSDTGSSGFFSRFSDEKVSDINVMNSKNSFDTNSLKAIQKEFDNLLSHPELQPYAQIVDRYRQETIQTGADTLAKTITNKFSIDSDANKAIASLNEIKSLGVNTDIATTAVIKGAAAIKSDQVGNILEATRQIMANTPGITVEEAVRQASASGAGVQLSAEQLTQKPETQIVSELTKGAQNQQFGQDPRTTATTLPETTSIVQPKTTGPQPGAQTQPQTANTPQQPALPSITSQLDFGQTSEQVKALQQFLNKAGFLVSSSGAGSVGNETTYFGPLTQAAVQKFQSSQGIVSSGDPTSTGYGRVGPKTLEAIKNFKF